MVVLKELHRIKLPKSNTKPKRGSLRKGVGTLGMVILQHHFQGPLDLLMLCRTAESSTGKKTLFTFYIKLLPK